MLWKHVIKTLPLVSLVAAVQCKSTNMGSETSSVRSAKGLGSESAQFDLNDVSILLPNLSKTSPADKYLHLSSKTAAGGPLLTSDMFDAVLKMVSNPRPQPYANWLMAAVRIDDCAKLLVQLPCTAQIRLVFQPTKVQGKFTQFDDQTLHLAFNVDAKIAPAMFADFLDLKRSASVSTKGPLGPNPVLASEGIDGAYGQKLFSLVLRYAVPNQVERVAVMTSSSAGSVASGSWNFGVTQPIKSGKVAQSPIPCQDPTQMTNTFATRSGFIGGPTPSLSPEMKGCDDVNISDLVLKRVDDTNKGKLMDAAIKTNNPDLTFFANTTCVNCHLASRRMDQVNGEGFSTKADDNKLRYAYPSDVSTGIVPEAHDDDTNLWGIRAFGWGEFGDVPGITVYTLNDSARVAHSLNGSIAKGEIK